eukprot:m.234239 g.234239  ORF g.234239 m.234239 type:complete len:587 (-) comp12634_c0_seq1:55-1815(-)
MALWCAAVLLAALCSAHKASSPQLPFLPNSARADITKLFPTLGQTHPMVRLDGPQAILSTSPATISDGGSVVLSITFDGWTPTPDDFVTVSCGPTLGPSDYLDVVTILDAAMDNPIQLPFNRLTFMRCNYTFSYYGVTFYPDLISTLIGKLEVPSADSIGAPKQGHLAYHNEPTRMTLHYTSGLSSPAPSVRLGTSEGALTTVFTGTTRTYGAGDLCSAPANQTGQTWFRAPGFQHTVELSDLTPDATYFYQYGNAVNGWSNVFSFHAAPVTGRGVRFVAFGDQDISDGGLNTSLAVTHEAVERDLDFVLHFGDLGYALGSAWIWDAWGSEVAEGASRVPYMVSVGNHEYDYSGGQSHDTSHPTTADSPNDASFDPTWWNNGATASNGECGTPVFYRFSAPSNGNSVFWYAFEYGNVFVVQLSSEHNFTTGSAEWNWLQATLAGVDRARTPWVVVTLHRPIYTTQMCETGDYVVSLHLRRALDPLFERYNVNVVLVAHTHSYERTCPLRGGVCVADGTGVVHLTVGSAGAGLETCGYSPRYGNFSRAHINTFGYLRAETTNEYMDLQFVLDVNGTVWDKYRVLLHG